MGSDQMEASPPIPQPAKKPPFLFLFGLSIVVCIAVSLLGIFILKDISSGTTPRVADAAKLEEELARKLQDAECEADLKCIGEKKFIKASFKCAPYVERLAKNNFEWTGCVVRAKI